ncbi:hypothetical protein OAK98_05535, partial [Mariniblastus sp.]|nr:hypothetical protein [Mariniblastus sp.]
CETCCPLVADTGVRIFDNDLSCGQNVMHQCLKSISAAFFGSDGQQKHGIELIASSCMLSVSASIFGSSFFINSARLVPQK